MKWTFCLISFTKLLLFYFFSWDKPEEAIDYNFQMAIDFVAALVEEQNGTRDGRKLRGPYLAQIHLLHELIKRGDPLANKIGKIFLICFS